MANAIPVEILVKKNVGMENVLTIPFWFVGLCLRWAARAEVLCLLCHMCCIYHLPCFEAMGTDKPEVGYAYIHVFNIYLYQMSLHDWNIADMA